MAWTLCGVLVSAALYAGAFPPLGLYPLAWLALVPLLVALARRGPLAGFGLGLGWALAVGLFTSWWLPGMIETYFLIGTASAWLAAALSVLATGAFYGLFGAWFCVLARQGLPYPLETALVWGACEYLRTRTALANPWVISGYSQQPFETIIQIADLGGVILVGMLMVACSAAIAGFLQPPSRRLRHRLETGMVALSVAAALLYGRHQLARSFEDGDEISVALVQSAIPRDRRFDARHRNENLAHHADLISRAGHAKPDMILLSELAIDVPLRAGSPESVALGGISEASGADVLVGAPRTMDLLVLRRTFNSFFILRGKTPIDQYDKVDLMPFSERNPFGSWLVVGRSAFAPGLGRRPLDSRGGPVGILLCSEAMLAGPARELVRHGAELLANPANDSWFAVPAAQMQLEIAAFRAIETRRWLLRPTMSGITAIVDPHGRISASAPIGDPGVLVGSVRRSRILTPFVLGGDVALGAVVAGALVVTLARLAARNGAAWSSHRRSPTAG